MDNVPLALSCTDFADRKIVFKQEGYDEHVPRHPELERSNFFPRRVIATLKRPDFTVRGHHNNTRCYYGEIFTIDGTTKYTKVVVSTTSEIINSESVYRIKTTHITDYIQEVKYGYRLQYH
jgi:hypothetical protein